MNSKTDKGVIVTATQRENTEAEIRVGTTIVGTGNMGELSLSSSVGDERGIRVRATISLDEVLAWLPEMTEKARAFAAAKARQELTEDIRKEGYHVTTSNGVKLLRRPVP